MTPPFDISLVRQNRSIESSLKIHFKGNFFPPIHSDFIPAAKEAIEAIENDDYQAMITMCNGKTITALEVVEGLKLHDFLDESLFIN